MFVLDINFCCGILDK